MHGALYPAITRRDMHVYALAFTPARYYYLRARARSMLARAFTANTLMTNARHVS